MSDLPAVEAEAEEAARQPRFPVWKGIAVSAAGSAAIAFVLTLALVFGWFGGFGGTDAPLWLVLVAALAYSVALLVWAGLWSRPSQAAGVIGASLVGLVAGYLLAIAVANLVSSGPDV